MINDKKERRDEKEGKIKKKGKKTYVWLLKKLFAKTRAINNKFYSRFDDLFVNEVIETFLTIEENLSSDGVKCKMHGKFYLIKMHEKYYATTGMVRTTKEIMINRLNRNTIAGTKRIVGVIKVMIKFMFSQVTKA